MAVDRVVFPTRSKMSSSWYSGQTNIGRVWITAAAILAGVMLIVSLREAYAAWQTCDPESIYLYGAGWIIGPPIWFWIEYFIIYRRYGDPRAFESYKFGQQISVAIWAGLALLLVGLANAERFKHPKANCSQRSSALVVISTPDA